MRIQRKWLWLSACALVPTAGVILSSILGADGHPEGVFRQAGYLTLRLTTDYHAPGSIYKVENESDGFVNLHPTCEVEESDFEGRVRVHKTADVSQAIERKLSAGYKMMPEKWRQVDELKLSGHLEGAQEVKVIYSNSRVLLLSTESMQGLLNDYLQRSGCFEAVRHDLSNGHDVCQTEAVIVSDLVYDISYQVESDSSLDSTIEGVIGVGGQVGSEVKSKQRIEGRKMYHAVKLHRSSSQTACIRLNSEESSEQEQALLSR